MLKVTMHRDHTLFAVFLIYDSHLCPHSLLLWPSRSFPYNDGVFNVFNTYFPSTITIYNHVDPIFP